MLVLMMISFVRSSSLRGFIFDSLTVGKIGVTALLFMAKFYYSLYYILICILAWIVTPYPRYQGDNKFIRVENEEQFNELIAARPIRQQK